jgi:hypothetical protein
MQFCHLESTANTTNVSSNSRIIGRTFGGIVLFVLGWTLRVTPSCWIYVTAVLLTFGVIFEEYGGVVIKNPKDKRLVVQLSDI